MAFSFLSSAAVLLVALFCHHVTALQQQTTHDLGCVHLPIIHSTNVNHFSDKRGVLLQLANRSDVAYYAQLSIGTPPQPVYVQLDTGSFELWVNPDCTSVTGSDEAFCQRAGHYDTTKSSTANSLDTTKTLQYGIGTANITYFTDTITLAGSTTELQAVQFGVATASQDAFSGILGIGYGKGIATKYPNFVDQLRAQNATQVKAYTLALGSKDAQEGVIVFGGIDTSKFAGRLAKVPIIPAAQSPDGVPRFWVNMDSVSLTPPSGVSRPYSGSSTPVFLDSGSTMTLLPPDLTAAIAADFAAQGPDASGFLQIDCSLVNVNGSLDFAFDGVTIKVPYKELTRQIPSNPPTCFLGIMPSEQFTLLGDTFLRSAYAVFDLETNGIWMSQAANCGSTPAALNNIQDLSSVTGVCGGVANLVVQPSSSSGSSNTGGTTLVPSPAASGSVNDNMGAVSTASTSVATPGTTTAASRGGSTTAATSGGSRTRNGGYVGSVCGLAMVLAMHLLMGFS